MPLIPPVPDHKWNDNFHVNLNKDSTHPNPWKPPSRLDQCMGFHHSAYKIYRRENQDTLLVPNPDINPLKKGTFMDKMLVSTWKGFAIGALASALDMVFITQSVSAKVNITRFLYITPPVMMMPISFTMTRELLDKQIGDCYTTYNLASLAPATVWGFFRQSPVKGVRMFIGIAIVANLCKMNADMGGLFLRGDWNKKEFMSGAWRYEKDTHFTTDPQIHRHSGSDFMRRNYGVEPTWKRFAEQDEVAKLRAKEEEVALKKAAEEEARLIAEAEVAAKKKAEEEAAAKIKAEEEAAAKIKAEEEEAARLKVEVEVARKKAEEAAAILKAKEEEAARLKAEEEEAARLEAEEKIARKKAEEEAAARLQAEEDEASRVKAEEEVARKKAEEDAAAILKAADEETVKVEEEEAVKIPAEEEIAREQAGEEAAPIIVAKIEDEAACVKVEKVNEITQEKAEVLREKGDDAEVVTVKADEQVAARPEIEDKIIDNVEVQSNPTKELEEVINKDTAIVEANEGGPKTIEADSKASEGERLAEDNGIKESEEVNATEEVKANEEAQTAAEEAIIADDNGIDGIKADDEEKDTKVTTEVKES